MNSVKVNSEIGQLKKVLLHRPSEELLNLVPDYLHDMLFDDIPYLTEARREHDYFAKVLRKCGAEVVYLADLVAQSLTNHQVRAQFVTQYIEEADSFPSDITKVIKEYLLSLPIRTLVDCAIAGIRKETLLAQVRDCPHLTASIISYQQESYPFVIPPMPNTYFSRDPFVFVGNGVLINKMCTRQRARETLLGNYIFNYHSDYMHLPKYYQRDYQYSIEGGDILVLNNKTLAVGVSERTQLCAIETLAKNLFADSAFEQILAIDIPKKRSFMHLDTVFTMINSSTFTIHPNTEGLFTVIKLSKHGEQIAKQDMQGTIKDILQRELAIANIDLIKCGGNNPIDAAREQWSDGANTLAVSPSEVIVYSRNTVTNKLLEQHGIKIHTIPCSELSRGRGGPRCMSMPIFRQDI